LGIYLGPPLSTVACNEVQHAPGGHCHPARAVALPRPAATDPLPPRPALPRGAPPVPLAERPGLGCPRHTKAARRRLPSSPAPPPCSRSGTNRLRRQACPSLLTPPLRQKIGTEYQADTETQCTKQFHKVAHVDRACAAEHHSLSLEVIADTDCGRAERGAKEYATIHA
jgi:hypothetical protein